MALTSQSQTTTLTPLYDCLALKTILLSGIFSGIFAGTPIMNCCKQINSCHIRPSTEKNPNERNPASHFLPGNYIPQVWPRFSAQITLIQNT